MGCRRHPLLLLLVGLGVASGEVLLYPERPPVVVPRDNCVWRGGWWGEYTYCGANEVPVASCGSGKNENCAADGGVYYDMIQCCPLEDYSYDSGGCTKYCGDHGVDQWCFDSATADTEFHNDIVEGVCGSGENKDCEGCSHVISCCHGAFGDGTLIYSAGSCYWQYAGYGVVLDCTGSDEGIFGRCGSGENADCDGCSDYHGIYCCKLIRF